MNASADAIRIDYSPPSKPEMDITKEVTPQDYLGDD